MSELRTSGSPSIGKIVLAIIIGLVGLWLIFAVILPLVKAVVSILLTIAVFGAVVWLVYKVATYDPDKRKV